MQKITPFIWFESQAEEAAKFYVSVFPNSKILNVARYGDAGPGPKGSVMTVSFQIQGLEFVALNGGSHYKLNPSISFVINCTSQEEVDRYWEKLLEGGQPMACGWLTDKFGVSWQVTPTALIEMIEDKDPVKSQRVMQAMMQMVKLDIATLKAAYEGRS